MNSSLSKFFTLVLLLGCQSLLAADWRTKVDADLLNSDRDVAAPTPVLIQIQTVNVPTPSAPVRADARRRFVAELKAHAAAAQSRVIAELNKADKQFRRFWISNSISVALNRDEISALAALSEVKHIHADRRLTLLEPEVDAVRGATCESTGAPPWGVTRVNAPQVWALGYTGQGIVIAGQDTGYQWDHPAIRDKYRGWNGSSADHNYHWWDAIRSGSNATCGIASPVPCDDHNHGTHTMGTMVGDAGAGNVIGVAPGAKWMACRNMNAGDGTLTTYNDCFQFFLEPTRLDGTMGDTAMAPDVINNSWGCPTSEGCNTSNFAMMETIVNNLQNAGVLVVGSAGNSGSACSTVNTPLAIFANVFSVGNSNSGDSMSTSSSRGPVTVDASNRLKPEISAPGSTVCSSIRGNTYANFSGTSMAGPHIAGVAALIMSAVPELRGDPEGLKQVMIATADPILGITQTCGGIPAGNVPNNVGGYGRVNALAAVQLALNQQGIILSDGFE